VAPYGRGVHAAAARAYFGLCLAAAALLRSATYSTTRIVREDGERRVLKRRRFYAPFLVTMGGVLLRVLDAGVRILPQREWEDRERRIHRRVYGTSIRTDAGGVLILPLLAGRTLASLLEDPRTREHDRRTAIERAVAALATFHWSGLTHGDAMAANVLIDLETGAARWFDFETTHDPERSMVWRRADDLRALLTTCLIRTALNRRADMLTFILDVYGDEEVVRVQTASFTPVWRRSLTFHLAQAGLSFHEFQDVARWLRERIGN
jgi:hypothetical protein